MIKVIVLGTDPSVEGGGVSIALRGYLSALEASGVPYEMIPTHRPGTAGARYGLWLTAVPRIVFAVRAARKLGVVPIVYCHAGAAPSLIRKFFLLVICKCLRARTALQIHAIDVDRYCSSKIGCALLKLAMGLSVDLLCVLTAWWREQFLRAGIKIPMVVIPNPLPVAWEARSKVMVKPKSHDGLVVCSISRLEPGKGVDITIEAMNLLPADVRLVIAGSGSQKVALERLTRVLGLENRVEFLGWLNEAEKQGVLDGADIFCLPTSYDSFGMGLVEAMASGLPVVALNIGPIPDVVPDGIAGVLVEGRDPRLVAEAINSLTDAHRRLEMGRHGQQWVASQFSSERVGLMLRHSLEAQGIIRG